MLSKPTGILVALLCAIGMATALPLALTGCGNSSHAQSTPEPLADPPLEGQPKYVFLFIGDGVATPQLHAAEIFTAAMAGGTDSGLSIKAPIPLSVSSFPHLGMATTYSADAFITDSAAAGTAIACGQKTDSGVIAMNAAKTVAFPTIAEKAKNAGMKVGIVSSVSIDHATPASFYAHAESRNDYFKIGEQLVASGFDYFGGGGFRENKYPSGKSVANDIRAPAVAAGYTWVENRAEFEALFAGSGKVIAVNAVRDGANALPYDMDRDRSAGNNDLSLAEFTKKGIALLENEDGFFMMVEGGKIDWACHANDAAAAIKDTLAFDAAIREALAFQAAHPEDTLIVVTGDHECGGMSLGFAGTGYRLDFSVIDNQQGSATAFDAAMDAASPETLEEIKPLIEDHFGLDTNEDGIGLPLSDHENTLLANAFSDFHQFHRIGELPRKRGRPGGVPPPLRILQPRLRHPHPHPEPEGRDRLDLLQPHGHSRTGPCQRGHQRPV